MIMMLSTLLQPSCPVLFTANLWEFLNPVGWGIHSGFLLYTSTDTLVTPYFWNTGESLTLCLTKMYLFYKWMTTDIPVNCIYFTITETSVITIFLNLKDLFHCSLSL